MNRGKEVLEELKGVISGKTLDAIIPPVIFLLVNSLAGLNWSVIWAVGVALVIGVIRLVLKQSWTYAFGGLMGVSIAAGFAYIAGNAVNYYMPKIIGGSVIFLITFLSLLIKKPLAAWVSHLSRGWDLRWFWRLDIRPAYSEVTLFWTLFFGIRLVILVILFNRQDTTGLFFMNTILGMPMNIGVLTVSYIYGIWRLRTLGGPGIEEFIGDVPKPWKGQTRGF